jgi:hypothetical protein
MFMIMVVLLGVAGGIAVFRGALLILWAVFEILRQIIMGD